MTTKPGPTCKKLEHQQNYDGMKNTPPEASRAYRRTAAYREWNDKYGKKLQRIRREATRKEVLSHYGGKCACCGYADLGKKVIHNDGYSQGFLQIDHIAGGGHKDIRQGNQIYGWLKRQGYPSGYRVLCAGCNASMDVGGEKCALSHLTVASSPS